MKYIKLFIILSIQLFIFSTNAQKISYKAYANGIMSEEINYEDYKQIYNPKIYNFVGQYGFGYSESEYELEIIYSNKKLYAREIYHPIINDFFGNEIKRIPIKYSNGEILFDEFSYQLFKCVRNSYINKKGDLGIGYISIDEENGQEIHSLSFHEKRADIKIKGKYPEASFVKLKKQELINYSKQELKIIRNEIFARNGHIFLLGGKMDKYFSNKNWYRGIKKINFNDLSEIEKHNIKIIKDLE